MRLGRALFGAVLLTCLSLSAIYAARAQNPLAPVASESGRHEVTAAPRGGPAMWFAWVQAQQRAYTRELAEAVRHVRDEGSPAAAWGLVAVSFLYGVLHAAGPGHGKAIISAYLLTHRAAVRRGLALAWLSAGMQGLVAVLLVLGLVGLLGLASAGARDAVAPLESVSFGLVALVGAWLAVRSVRGLYALRGRGGGDRAASDAGHACGHSADHLHQGAHCGHAHMPSPDEAARLQGWREALPVILSVGIRPCSGAVVVLLIAEAMGLRLAGIAAVFAMSVGTALAVSALALFALFARRAAALALVSSGRVSGRGVALAGGMVALAGGLLIFALGAVLFAGSLGSAGAPPL